MKIEELQKLPRRAKQYYKFLCEYEKATENNAKSAPSYNEKLHESGANSAISAVKEEFYRVFENVLCTF